MGLTAHRVKCMLIYICLALFGSAIGKGNWTHSRAHPPVVSQSSNGVTKDLRDGVRRNVRSCASQRSAAEWNALTRPKRTSESRPGNIAGDPPYIRALLNDCGQWDLRAFRWALRSLDETMRLRTNEPVDGRMRSYVTYRQVHNLFSLDQPSFLLQLRRCVRNYHTDAWVLELCNC